MKTIVFYGAGQNARDNYAKWAANGLVPVCFADSDSAKHNTMFNVPGSSEQFEILPLLEIMERYPDYELYLTQVKESLVSVTESLLGLGIPHQRIKYCDGYQESRYCWFLESSFCNVLLDNGKLDICCSPYYNTKMLARGDFKDDYKLLIKYSTNLRERLRLGMYTHCDGCPTLTGSTSNKSKKTINISSGFRSGAKCNFKCCYCPSVDVEYKPAQYNKQTILDVFYAMEHMFEQNEIELQFTYGDISANKDADEILRIWNKNRWEGSIYTNCSVYREGVFELLREKLIFISVSPDAGTRETFRRIKGVDCYDKVVQNIKKYAKSGGRINLKYIILDGINDNETDVNGFAELVSEIAAQTDVYVTISSDFRYFERIPSESEWYAARHLIEKCRSKNIHWQTDCNLYAEMYNELKSK